MSKKPTDKYQHLLLTGLAQAQAVVDSAPELLRRHYGARACRRAGIDDAAQEAGLALTGLRIAIAQLLDEQRLIDLLIPPATAYDDDDLPF